MLSDSFVIKIITIAVVTILVIIKTILFANINDYKNLAGWFHFNIYHVVNSSTLKLEKAKKLQNVLTTFIGVSVALTAVLFYFVK